jgi:hypothetical protein
MSHIIKEIIITNRWIIHLIKLMTIIKIILLTNKDIILLIILIIKYYQQIINHPLDVNISFYHLANSYNRNHSNLSSYGTNSLSLNQNDIYSKQNSKFNIITMQPK